MARASDPVLAREAAGAVVRTLRGAGHIAYFAGGCVRDELLGLAPTDYDVATDATPDRVAALFERTMLVGAAFGVVLVPCPGGSIEVATFRSDGPYSDARRPDRIHFSDPVSDAKRRDFTINALFLDPLATGREASFVADASGGGVVIDYVDGMRDLHARVVRAVGDPDQRLSEDHLRALRAVRFAARLGFAIDPGTAAAITRHASELRGVSRERIGEEVRRMLTHPARARAVALLQELGLDVPVIGDAPGGREARAVPTLEGLASSADPVAYPTVLAAWALDRCGDMSGSETQLDSSRPGDGGRGGPWKSIVAAWRTALCLSNEDRDALGATLQAYSVLKGSWLGAREATQKRVAMAPGFGPALSLFKVREPDRAAMVEGRLVVLRGSLAGLDPAPWVTGDDLVGLGMRPNPRFKGILDEVFDAQLEGRVRSREEAMELAKKLSV